MAGRYFNRQGGVSRCMAELAERAGRGGHDVTVFTHEALDCDGVDARFVRVRMVTRPFSLQIPSFSLALRRRMRGSSFDLVHAQGPQALGADVYTAHSCHTAFLERRRSESGLRGRLSLVYPPHEISRRWERRCFGDAPALIAVSEVIKRELRESLGVPDDRIHVIYNGVDTKAFAPAQSREEARRALGQAAPPHEPNEAVLVFVGYEFRRKGLGQAIRALAGVEGVRLWVVGGDDPEPYRALAARLGVAGRVHFTGHRQDVAAWLRAADALVFPTSYEPFGLVILEALACGTPVVTSRIAGAAELITDGREGFLLDDPADSGELAAALRRLLSMRDRWPQLTASARSLAESYDWDAIWAATCALYDELAAAKARAAPLR